VRGNRTPASPLCLAGVGCLQCGASGSSLLQSPWMRSLTREITLAISLERPADVVQLDVTGEADILPANTNLIRKRIELQGFLGNPIRYD
jgi:hypothetical protein